jgi:prepilin signal peptidase PulO-like enzyme (type II secretory pathway)
LPRGFIPAWSWPRPAGGVALAGFYGITLLISGRATGKHQIPFGPFTIAGAFLVILAGAL